MAKKVVRCRGCGKNLIGVDASVISVQPGSVEGIEDGVVDFDANGDPWGYFHLQCFLMGIGDPEGIAMALAI